MKKCSKCGIVKDDAQFVKDKARKTGLSCDCKKCRHDYYVSNRARILERQKRYVNGRKEETRKYQKGYRRENREKLAEYNKNYHARNSEEIRKWRKAHYLKNREENIKKSVEWGKRNPDKRKAIYDNWVRNNPSRSYEIKSHYADKNRDKLNAKAREKNKTDSRKQIKGKYRKKAITNLYPSYVKEVLRQNGFLIAKNEMPEDLIEVKKIIIKIKRYAKEKEKRAVN